MKKYVAYVASPMQTFAVKSAILRIQGKPLKLESALTEGFEVKHAFLGETTLEVHLLSDLESLAPFLRQSPVDLLVYDERGEDAVQALIALAKIRSDFQSLAELWGPDFLFPMSRVVAILAGDNQKSQAHRAFELGRVQVRDVCVAPKNTVVVLKWMHRLLTEKIDQRSRIGVALSGGGVEGFLYQLGVMYALERALDGKSIHAASVFSGVSSGSICAAVLAAKIPLIEVIKAVHKKSDLLPPLNSSTVFDLASREILSRFAAESLVFPGFSPKDWVRQTLRKIPTGFFKGEELRKYFKRCFEIVGNNDEFRSLDSELFIGATDQDTFEHVVFGKDPWLHIPISDAIRASTALPPVYLPAQIQGRWFVDGQITRTCNLELVVESGCSLVLIIDPVKPLATLIPGSVDKMGGIHATIQAVKALVYTRFHNTLMHLTERYPNTDFIVFQPDEEVAQLMAGSPMRYKIRTQLVEFSYRQTMRQLRDRHHVYAAKFGKFGVTLRPKKLLSELEHQDRQLFESLN